MQLPCKKKLKMAYEAVCDIMNASKNNQAYYGRSVFIYFSESQWASLGSSLKRFSATWRNQPNLGPLKGEMNGHVSIHGWRTSPHQFDPRHWLDVKFIDKDGLPEGAIDAGGPTLDLFQHLMMIIQELNIFKGPPGEKFPFLDIRGMCQCHLRIIGWSDDGRTYHIFVFVYSPGNLSHQAIILW